jgi:hypothetical protein
MDLIENRENTIESEGLDLLQCDKGEMEMCCAGSLFSALPLCVDSHAVWMICHDSALSLCVLLLSEASCR